MIFSLAERRPNDASSRSAGRTLLGVLSAYAGILFVDHWLIGLAYLAATFWFPNVGLSGLVGAIVGMLVGYGLRLPYATSGVNVYSSLLVGLSLGAYYELNPNLLLLITLSSALTVMLAATLRSFLWQLGHLPVLSVPFVVVALTAALAASTYGGLDAYYEPSQLPPPLLGDGNALASWLDTFLSALGSTFFSPHPLVGAVLFVGVLVRSRYLAFLCMAGFLSGQTVFTTLAAEPPAGLLAWTGFNFALTAMALGGIFTVPSITSFVVAIAGAGASAVVSGAMARFLLVYNLPVMALPFLLTTLTLLAALRMRVATTPPILLLEEPGLPETNYERARLAATRLGSLGSVPLLAPFLGEWQIYQGFDGPHTHRREWRYALDFHRVEDGQSYRGDGLRLEDFHCFGLPVLSPAYGVVVAVEDALPDNPPGDIDSAHNWGNHVLIRTDGGLCVLLAHLAQSSARVREGVRVTPGTPIASCGNSGRSPQPHLHLQVQRHAGLGGATVPFHIVSAIVRGKDAKPRYEIVAALDEGDAVQRAEEDRRLTSGLHLPAGRVLSYRLEGPTGAGREETLTVEVTLLGQHRLVAVNGASAAFEHRNGILAFYDRQGPASIMLDLWLLCAGLTPLSSLPLGWHDAPSAQLLPLSRSERALLGVLRPLGTGLDSAYSRSWSEQDGVFVQTGEHRLRAAGMRRSVTTRARLDPHAGFVDLVVERDGRQTRAALVAIAQRGDVGIPAWQTRVAASGAGGEERT